MTDNEEFKSAKLESSDSAVKVASKDELKKSMGLNSSKREAREGRPNLFKKRKKSPKGQRGYQQMPAPTNEKLMITPVLQDKYSKTKGLFAGGPRDKQESYEEK